MKLEVSDHVQSPWIKINLDDIQKEEVSASWNLLNLFDDISTDDQLQY